MQRIVHKLTTQKQKNLSEKHSLLSQKNDKKYVKFCYRAATMIRSSSTNLPALCMQKNTCYIQVFMYICTSLPALCIVVQKNTRYIQVFMYVEKNTCTYRYDVHMYILSDLRWDESLALNSTPPSNPGTSSPLIMCQQVSATLTHTYTGNRSLCRVLCTHFSQPHCLHLGRTW